VIEDAQFGEEFPKLDMPAGLIRQFGDAAE